MVTLEERVSTLETEFRTELRHLATKADISDLRTEIANLRAEFKADLQAMQTRLIFSMAGTMIAAIAAVAAIMRFLA